MKKSMLAVFTTICIIYLCGCTGKGHTKTYDVSGIFPDNFFQDTTAIVHYAFDETITTYTDPDTIQAILLILKNGEYEMLDPEDYRQGGHMFDFIVNGEAVDVMLDSSFLVTNGHQYVTEERYFDPILQMLDLPVP